MSKLFLIVALSLLSINGVISFDDNGPVGAIIILLGIVAFIGWIFVTSKDAVKAWLERRKKAIAIKEARARLDEAREQLTEAKEEADLDPSNVEKANAVKEARAAVANAKAALVAAKA